MGEDGFRGGLDRLLVGDVEGEDFGVAAGGGDLGGDLLELVFVAGGEGDVEAVLRRGGGRWRGRFPGRLR